MSAEKKVRTTQDMHNTTLTYTTYPTSVRCKLDAAPIILGTRLGPEGAQHRCTDLRHKLSTACASIRQTSPSFVRRLASLKITAITVLSNIGSVAELDKALSWSLQRHPL